MLHLRRYMQNMKTILIALAILFVLIFAINGVARLVTGGPARVAPQQMLQAGLDNTMASKSFRYHLEARLTREGEADVTYFSRVDGEVVMPDRVKISGTMMNTPVEFIQIGDTSYYKDIFTGRWVTLPGSRLADSELFYAELNPLAYFNFKDVSGLVYKGVEKINGEKLLRLEMQPNLMDPFIELRLTGYHLTLWLAQDDHRLRQAALRARDRHNPQNGVEIDLRFWDYGRSIIIEPPG